MFVAKYTTGPLKLYAGYEHIRYTGPSDPQTAFTDIAENFLCQGCQAFNNTNINNAAFGVNGLGKASASSSTATSSPRLGCAFGVETLLSAHDARFAPRAGCS